MRFPAALAVCSILSACAASSGSSIEADRDAAELPDALRNSLALARSLDARRPLTWSCAPPAAPTPTDFLDFVTRETGRAVDLADGVALDMALAGRMADRTPAPERDVRGEIAHVLCFQEPRLVCVTDERGLHVLREKRLDEWIARRTPDADERRVLEHLLVRWSEPVIERRDDEGPTSLVVEGRCVWRDEDGRERPLALPASMVVQVARSPGEPVSRCIWDSRFDPVASEYASFRRDAFAQIVRPEERGTFQFSMLTSELRRAAGRPSSFSVGVYLPAIDPVVVGGLTARIRCEPSTWTVSGPEPLDAEATSLNAARSSAWVGNDSDFDPIALLRAANLLRAKGKAGAIAALRSLLARSNDAFDLFESIEGCDLANPETIDPIAIELLVELVFDVSPAHGVAPRYEDEISKRTVADFEQGWPLYALGGHYIAGDSPLTVIGGVPFLTVAWLGGRTGCDRSASLYLDLAECCGKLRPEMLVPPDDPTEAADELLARQAIPEHDDIRGQIVRSLERSIGTVNAWSLDKWRHPMISDADWQRVREDLRRRGVHWDAERQQYVERER